MTLDSLTEGLMRKALELHDTINLRDADAERRAAACREAASLILARGGFGSAEFSLAGEMFTEGRVVEGVRALLDTRPFKVGDVRGGLGPFRFWKRLPHGHDCERRGRLDGDDPLVECTCYLEPLADGDAPGAAGKLVRELEWALEQEVQFRPVPYGPVPFGPITREAVAVHAAAGARWCVRDVGTTAVPPQSLRIHLIHVRGEEIVTYPALVGPTDSAMYAAPPDGFEGRPVDADGLPLRATASTPEAP